MYKEQIDMARLPQHIAFIMDGNGRWAQARGQQRSYGHFAGADTLEATLRCATKLGIPYVTFYAFSTENWSRPQDEVNTLLDLMLKHLEEKIFMENDVKFLLVGDIENLPQNLRDASERLMEKTKNNKAITMGVAFNYSSRWELAHAAKIIAKEVKEGKMKLEDITAETIDRHLATGIMPNPDLLIRTGGEQRLSNFQMWQLAYAELYFTDTYWPDFNDECLYKAIVDYQSRQRRFGKTGEQVTENK